MKVYSVKEISEILQCCTDVARSIAKRLPHCEVGLATSSQPKIMVSESVLNDYICGKIEIREEDSKPTYATKKARKIGKVKSPRIEYRK